DAGTGKTTAVYAGRAAGDFTTATRLSDTLDRAILEQQLTGHGVAAADAATLTKGVRIKTRQVRDGKEIDSSTIGSFIAAYVMAFLLTFTVMMYGMNVGRSVIQEKRRASLKSCSPPSSPATCSPENSSASEPSASRSSPSGPQPLESS